MIIIQPKEPLTADSKTILSTTRVPKEHIKTNAEKTSSKQYKEAFVSIQPIEAEPNVYERVVRAATYAKELIQGS
jgi:hypothetical protein